MQSHGYRSLAGPLKIEYGKKRDFVAFRIHEEYLGMTLVEPEVSGESEYIDFLRELSSYFSDRFYYFYSIHEAIGYIIFERGKVVKTIVEDTHWPEVRVDDVTISRPVKFFRCFSQECSSHFS